MSLPRCTRRASLAVPVALLALAAAAPAAPAKPSLRLNLPAQADAGTRIPFTYATKGLPRRGKLVVLRRQGTAGAWRVIKTVKRRRSGSATLPAMDWGSTDYRLAVVRGNRATARSGRRSMGVFKTVTLGELFGLTASTVTTPTRTFNYVLSTNDYVGREQVVSVGTSNPCRAIHVDWTTSSVYSVMPSVVYSMSVVQQSADPVGSQAPFQEISGFDTPLVPGQSWTLSFGFGGSGVASVDANVDGTASCTGPISLKAD